MALSWACQSPMRPGHRLPPTAAWFVVRTFGESFLGALLTFAVLDLLASFIDKFDALMGYGFLRPAGSEYLLLKLPLMTAQLMPVACLAGSAAGSGDAQPQRRTVGPSGFGHQPRRNRASAAADGGVDFRGGLRPERNHRAGRDAPLQIPAGRRDSQAAGLRLYRRELAQDPRQLRGGEELRRGP